jgi:hypothetical protein
MKEEQRLGKVHKVALKAQVTTTSEMAVAMCAKVETLQKHMALQLFTMHVDLLIFDPKAKKYLQPRRSEELAKLKWRLSVPQNSTLLPHNPTHVFMVRVTKINIGITMDIATTIVVPISNFVQEDLTSVVLSPKVIKKLDNVNCSIFDSYNNQQDSFEPCNEHDEDNSSSFDLC